MFQEIYFNFDLYIKKTELFPFPLHDGWVVVTFLYIFRPDNKKQTEVYSASTIILHFYAADHFRNSKYLAMYEEV